MIEAIGVALAGLLLVFLGAVLHIRFRSLLPYIALVLAIAAPPRWLPTAFGVAGRQAYLADAFLPLAAVFALRRRSRTRDFDVFAWLFVGVITLGVIMGARNGNPWSAFVQDTRGPAYLVCSYFIASRLFRPVHLKPVLAITAAILWFTAASMIVTEATGVAILKGGRTQQVSSSDLDAQQTFDSTRFLLQPKTLGFIALFVSGSLLLSRRRPFHRSWAVAGLYLVPGLVISFLAFSRSSLLGLAAASVVLVLLARSFSFDARRVLFGSVALASILAVSVLVGGSTLLNNPDGNLLARQVAAFDARVIQGLSGSNLTEDRGNEWRVVEARLAWKAIKQQPLMGHGLGAAYRPADTRTGLSSFKNDPTYGTRFVHNLYLFYLVKVGVVGLASLMALVLYPALAAATRTIRAKDPGGAVLALFAAILGILAINLFFPDLQDEGGAATVGSVIGYLALQAVQRRPPPVEIDSRSPVTQDHLPVASGAAPP